MRFKVNDYQKRTYVFELYKCILLMLWYWMCAYVSVYCMWYQMIEKKCTHWERNSYANTFEFTKQYHLILIKLTTISHGKWMVKDTTTDRSNIKFNENNAEQIFHCPYYDGTIHWNIIIVLVDDGRVYKMCVYTRRIYIILRLSDVVAWCMCISFILAFFLSFVRVCVPLYLLQHHHCCHHQQRMIRVIKEFLLLLEGHKHCPKWWCYCILSLPSGMQRWYGSNNA